MYVGLHMNHVQNLAPWLSTDVMHTSHTVCAPSVDLDLWHKPEVISVCCLPCVAAVADSS